MEVYFDNASTTPLLSEVQEAMMKVIQENFGNPSSIHLQGRRSRILVEDARKTIAQGLKASTGEIFFTSGATEANNTVLLGAINSLGVKRIISTEIEHHCILHTLDYIEKIGDVEIILLPVDNYGQINLDRLKQVLDDTPSKTLVSIMHGNNEIGSIADIESIAKICKASQALFHTDTAQTIGKIPIDLVNTPISFLCGASHKFFGPKGIGFLYVNNDNQIQPLMHGGDQERGMRSGTENIYGITGMAVAFARAMEEMTERKTKILAVKRYFTGRLTEELHDIKLNSTDNGLYHVLSVSFPPTDRSDMLMMNLDIAGIAASSGSACSSGVENDSHVLKAIGHDPRRKTVRFSLSHYNTKEEVDYVMEQLKNMTPRSAAPA